MGCSKSSSKRKFIVIQSYLKKQEKHQINNLTLPLTQLEKEEQKNPKPMGCSKSSFNRKIYSNTILPQETRKTSNRQPNFTLQTTGKRKTTTTTKSQN